MVVWNVLSKTAGQKETGVGNMPSDKTKELKVAKGSGKDNKNKKNHKSIGWIIGVVVLVLISITFIFPATGFSTRNNNAISFGSYNGEAIELSYGNYFYTQLNNLYANYPDIDGFSLYYQAFNNTVFGTALKQLAKAAGIEVTDAMVVDAIKNDSSFQDENGNYDPSGYASLSEMERNTIWSQVEDSLPVSLVLQDINTVKTSQSEIDFVADLNTSTRGFEYVVVGSDSYPDEEAIAYAEANPAPFTYATIAYATYSSEEEALAAVAADSTDPVIGDSALTYYYALENTLQNKEDAALIFSLSEGELSAPIASWYGWRVYRMVTEAAEADLTDEDALSTVKSYIQTYENETMSGYLSAKADEIYQALSEDAEAAVAEYGLEVNTVYASSPNPAGSQFVIGLEYGDINGTLAAAASMDSDYYTALFTSDYNEIIEPQVYSGSYVIARAVESDSDNAILASYLSSVYDAYVPEITINDLYGSVLTSDKLDNQFINTYFNSLYN